MSGPADSAGTCRSSGPHSWSWFAHNPDLTVGAISWRPSGPHLAAAVACALLAGCSQDMYDQPRLETFEASRFFKDDASAREQPMGTVARDQPFAGDPYFSGKRDGEFLTSIPSPPNSEGDFLDRAFVERGRERFNIYCAPCHGGTGEGNGMIVQRGFPKPPSLHEERLREGTVDGQIFDVISNGFRRMPRYGPRIPADDRWRIVAYVRALQRSQHLPLDDAPADIRAQLERGTP